MDENKLVEYAINISKGTYIPEYMGSLSALFGATNENQNEISKILDYSDKRIITTGSSGEQYFSAVVNGSKDETIFDINSFAKYYIYLKTAAIRNLKLEDFIEFMFPYGKKKKYLETSLMNFIYKDLPKDVQEFWYKYMSEVDKKNISKFICFDDKKIEHVMYRLDYLSEKKYKLLKERLLKRDYPKVLELDANNFFYYIKPEVEKKGKYDIINFSNIIECNRAAHYWDDDFYGLYSDEEWISYINNWSTGILTPNGVLFLLYKFTDQFKEFKSYYNITGFKNDIFSEEKDYGLTLKRK